MTLLTPLISALRAENLAGAVSAENDLEHADGLLEGLAQGYGFRVCGHSGA